MLLEVQLSNVEWVRLGRAYQVVKEMFGQDARDKRTIRRWAYAGWIRARRTDGQPIRSARGDSSWLQYDLQDLIRKHPQLSNGQKRHR